MKSAIAPIPMRLPFLRPAAADMGISRVTLWRTLRGRGDLERREAIVAGYRQFCARQICAMTGGEFAEKPEGASASEMEQNSLVPA